MAGKVLSGDELVGLPELTVGMKLVEAPPFIGVCVIDQIVQGDYGKQVHIGVRPLWDVDKNERYEKRAGSGVFHTNYPISTAAKSKCGYLMQGAARVFEHGTRVGMGDLLGQVCVWIRKDIEFGKNRETGETMKAAGVLLPVRRCTADELDQLGEIDYSIPDEEEGRTNGTVVPTATESQWSEEDIAAMADILHGRTKKEASYAAGRDKELTGPQKQAIMNGAAVRLLEGQGILAMAADGEHYVITR